MGGKPSEYREGEKVAREFERAMKTVFQTPKPERETKRPTETASQASEQKSDKD